MKGSFGKKGEIAWHTPFWMGVDENGLGPRLGPLVVTGVLARTEGEGAHAAQSRPRGKLAERLGDSKKLVAFQDDSLGEAWARAVGGRMLGRPARTPSELFYALCMDPPEELQRPCPSHHRDMCFREDAEHFEAPEACVAEIGRDLDKLQRKGIQILAARTVAVCTRSLNDAAARGLSRFDVDLHAMERLVLWGRGHADDAVHATCGKVGGIDAYPARFGPLGGHLHTALVEGRARSEYRFPGVGQIAFVRDADDAHLLVCMASMIGKWVREMLMRRIVRYHQSEHPELPDASGYHDPVTTRFIAASAPVRKRLNVLDACFERVRVGDAQGASDAPKSRNRSRAGTRREETVP